MGDEHPTPWGEPVSRSQLGSDAGVLLDVRSGVGLKQEHVRFASQVGEHRELCLTGQVSNLDRADQPRTLGLRDSVVGARHRRLVVAVDVVDHQDVGPFLGERCAERSVRDRFTSDMLERYCQALGIDMFNVGATDPTSFSSKNGEPVPSHLTVKTLAEVQQWLGIVPGERFTDVEHHGDEVGTSRAWREGRTERSHSVSVEEAVLDSATKLAIGQTGGVGLGLRERSQLTCRARRDATISIGHGTDSTPTVSHPPRRSRGQGPLRPAVAVCVGGWPCAVMGVWEVHVAAEVEAPEQPIVGYRQRHAVE